MTIFIGGLTDSTDEAALNTLFRPYGQISNMRLVRHTVTQESMRYAFITMPSDDEARRAIDALHRYWLEGRKLTVQDADTDQRHKPWAER